MVMIPWKWFDLRICTAQHHPFVRATSRRPVTFFLGQGGPRPRFIEPLPLAGRFRSPMQNQHHCLSTIDEAERRQVCRAECSWWTQMRKVRSPNSTRTPPHPMVDFPAHLSPPCSRTPELRHPGLHPVSRPERNPTGLQARPARIGSPLRL